MKLVNINEDIILSMILYILLLVLVASSETIEWVDYQQGMSAIESTHKPGIVLIHHSTCPACVNLHRIMDNSDRVKQLSKSFVMISCKDGVVPPDPAFKGGY